MTSFNETFFREIPGPHNRHERIPFSDLLHDADKPHFFTAIENPLKTHVDETVQVRLHRAKGFEWYQPKIRFDQYIPGFLIGLHNPKNGS